MPDFDGDPHTVWQCETDDGEKFTITFLRDPIECIRDMQNDRPRERFVPKALRKEADVSSLS